LFIGLNFSLPVKPMSSIYTGHAPTLLPTLALLPGPY